MPGATGAIGTALAVVAAFSFSKKTEYNEPDAAEEGLPACPEVVADTFVSFLITANIGDAGFRCAACRSYLMLLKESETCKLQF